MRILVVEDNPKIAGSIKKGLEQESFAVDIALDGIKGFDLAVVEDYDIIILDLMLPGMDGMEVCRKLRQEEKISTKILMLTAKNQLEDRVEGLNTGADDYLAKPFAFKELIARIRALTRRPKKTLNNTLKIKDLELDSSNQQVKRAGKTISLSKKEYSLLEYLLRNKNKILSKQELINHVWDYNADILENTVEVYIGYLRNKIEKPFINKPKLIKTIKGFGYKII